MQFFTHNFTGSGVDSSTIFKFKMFTHAPYTASFVVKGSIVCFVSSVSVRNVTNTRGEAYEEMLLHLTNQAASRHKPAWRGIRLSSESATGSVCWTRCQNEQFH